MSLGSQPYLHSLDVNKFKKLDLDAQNIDLSCSLLLSLLPFSFAMLIRSTAGEMTMSSSMNPHCFSADQVEMFSMKWKQPRYSICVVTEAKSGSLDVARCGLANPPSIIVV